MRSRKISLKLKSKMHTSPESGGDDGAVAKESRYLSHAVTNTPDSRN
jgi:hypothetical protein